MKLISKAYSSLGLTVLASMTGLSLDEARRAAIDRGWSIDGTMVQPCKLDEDECTLPNEICLTEDQLQKLTQFVSFLENWRFILYLSFPLLLVGGLESCEHDDRLEKFFYVVSPRNPII